MACVQQRVRTTATSSLAAIAEGAMRGRPKEDAVDMLAQL